MKRVGKVTDKLMHSPKWVLLILPPIVFAMLSYVLAYEKNGIPEYLIYGMSVYHLTIWVLPIPQLFQKAKAYIIKQLNCTKFGRQYVRSLAFRGNVSLYSGMMVNFLYVVFRFFVGVRYASVWFITIAIYYLILGLIRLSLILSYNNRKVKTELHCYRRTGWLLFTLNIPLGGMILLMVLTGSGYSYPRYVIYLSALYAFYTVILSVINVVKFRKLGSPILSAAKILNFVVAIISLLGLQTAMISQFSSNTESSHKIMNAITGGGVWFAVILIAVYMLIHSRKTKEVELYESLRE